MLITRRLELLVAVATLLLLFLYIVQCVGLGETEEETEKETKGGGSYVVDIQIEPGTCLSVIVPDGYMHNCDFGSNKKMSLSLLDQNSKYASVIASSALDGRLLDFITFDIESIKLQYQRENSRLQAYDKIIITWPKVNSTLYTTRFDIHYSNPDKPDRVSNACVLLLKQVGDTTPKNYIVITEPFLATSSSQIKMDVLFPGHFVAVVYAFSSSWPNLAGIKSHEDVIKHGEVLHEIPFTVVEPVELVSSSDDPILIASNDVLLKLFNNRFAFPNEQGNESIIHISMMSVRSLERYEEGEAMIKSLLFNYNKIKRNEPTVLIVLHLIVDEGGQEFFERLYNTRGLSQSHPYLVFLLHRFDKVCSTPLDRFLNSTHMDMSFHHSGAAGYCRLFMHEYFRSSGIVNTIFLPTSFCSDIVPNQCKLSENSSNNSGSSRSGTRNNDLGVISNSYSNVEVRVDHDNSIFFPDKIIALESDQLILGDIRELWDYFHLFPEEVMIAAPENYQPWRDSRPFSKSNGNSNSNSSSNDSDISVRSIDNDYHGYGLIGGIMLLHIKKMSNRDFSSDVLKLFTKFREIESSKEASIGINCDNFDVSSSLSATASSVSLSSNTVSNVQYWQAKLNDQDVFNSILTLSPEWFLILPCEWNIQLHARLNSIMHCQKDIPSYKAWESNKPTTSASGSTRYDFFQSNNIKFDDIPLNCPKLQEKRIFVCEKRAKVVHYQAQSYISSDFLNYYAGLWNFYSKLSWTLF